MRVACRRHRGRCHGLQFERQRSPVREPVSKTLPLSPVLLSYLAIYFTLDLIRNYRRKQATAGQTFTTLPGDNPGSAPPVVRDFIHGLDDGDTTVLRDLGDAGGQAAVGDEGLDLADMADAHRAVRRNLVLSATRITWRALAMMACAAWTSR